MIDEQLILTVERLGDALEEFRLKLRKRYPSPDKQVTSDDLKSEAARLAETWMVDLAQREEVVNVVGPDYRADLAVHFQRLLILSEHASKRFRYEDEVKSILKRFTVDLVIPLKQLRSTIQQTTTPLLVERSAQRSDARSLDAFDPSAFVGHSFASNDESVASCIIRGLEAIGIRVITGEKPKADQISEKVKKRIDEQYLFVGIFTRREKISRKQEWTTSPWVIDEKAYAVGRGKKLILFKEKGVGSIGGIQGDYEYVEFSRDRLQDVVINLLRMFDLSARGLSG